MKAFICGKKHAALFSVLLYGSDYCGTSMLVDQAALGVCLSVEKFS